MSIQNRGGYHRDSVIDFVKGVGIILMVFRHANGPYSDFVLLFHMAIFFIASGWLINLKYSADIPSILVYIKKKIRGLWVPYVGFNVAYLVLNDSFIKLNILTNDPEFIEAKGIDGRYLHLTQPMGVIKTGKEIIKVFLFQGGTDMGGALWFFNTLFFVLILYMILQFVLCRIMKDSHIELAQLIVAILFLVAGYCCQRRGISAHGLSRVLSYYCFIYLGHVFHKYNVINTKIKPFILFTASLLVLLLMYHHGSINLAANDYPNPVFLIVASVAGWTMLYSLGILLQKTKIFTSVLQYISIHSVPIVGMHFLCFKIVSSIAVLALGMKMYMIAAFPVLELPGAWWLLYTVVGISIPLLADRVWIMVRRRILARLNIPVSGHHHSEE